MRPLFASHLVAMLLIVIATFAALFDHPYAAVACLAAIFVGIGVMGCKFLARWPEA